MFTAGLALAVADGTIVSLEPYLEKRAQDLYALLESNDTSRKGSSIAGYGAVTAPNVYADGEWKDVVVCADNASVMSHLVASAGTYNDYLEFDLGGIVAEKVRIYISASSSASGTTYEEIECNGYAK